MYFPIFLSVLAEFDEPRIVGENGGRARAPVDGPIRPGVPHGSHNLTTREVVHVFF